MPNLFEVLADQLGQARKANSISGTVNPLVDGQTPPGPSQGGILAKLLGLGHDQPAPNALASLPAAAPQPSAGLLGGLLGLDPAPAAPAPAAAPPAPQMGITGKALGFADDQASQPPPAVPNSGGGQNQAGGGVRSQTFSVQPLPTFAATQGAPTSAPDAKPWAGQMFSGLEKRFNLPSGFLAGTMAVESGGDSNATSSTGAQGPFQFTKGTAAQYGLSNPRDLMQSAYAAAQLASDNAGVLRNALGRDPTPGELYLAHQQGAKTAAALLANPDAPAGQVLASLGVSPRNIAVNGGNPNAPASAFTQKWTSRFGSGAGSIGGTAPTVAMGSDPRFGGLDTGTLPIMAALGLTRLHLQRALVRAGPRTALVRPMRLAGSLSRPMRPAMPSTRTGVRPRWPIQGQARPVMRLLHGRSTMRRLLVAHPRKRRLRARERLRRAARGRRSPRT